MFGTLFSSCDSVITIHNHWVPLKKKMFGTHNLSEDWNPNLNFMWVPWQIWEHPRACFWIQAGFKSGLNLWVPVLLPLLGPRSFSPHFLSLSLSLSPLDASLSLSLSHYRATPTPHSTPLSLPWSLSMQARNPGELRRRWSWISSNPGRWEFLEEEA